MFLICSNLRCWVRLALVQTINNFLISYIKFVITDPSTWQAWTVYWLKDMPLLSLLYYLKPFKESHEVTILGTLTVMLLDTEKLTRHAVSLQEPDPNELLVTQLPNPHVPASTSFKSICAAFNQFPIDEKLLGSRCSTAIFMADVRAIYAHWFLHS